MSGWGGPRSRGDVAKPAGIGAEALFGLRSAGLILTLLLASSCDLLGVRVSANQACAEQAKEFGPAFTVAGAFDTRVDALRDMQPLAAEPELWPRSPGDSPAIVCFLDGPVPKAPPGGEQFDRAVVGVVDDDAVLVVAGYQDTIPIRSP